MNSEGFAMVVTKSRGGESAVAETSHSFRVGTPVWFLNAEGGKNEGEIIAIPGESGPDTAQVRWDDGTRSSIVMKHLRHADRRATPDPEKPRRPRKARSSSGERAAAPKSGRLPAPASTPDGCTITLPAKIMASLAKLARPFVDTTPEAVIERLLAEHAQAE